MRSMKPNVAYLCTSPMFTAGPFQDCTVVVGQRPTVRELPVVPQQSSTDTL